MNYLEICVIFIIVNTIVWGVWYAITVQIKKEIQDSNQDKRQKADKIIYDHKKEVIYGLEDLIFDRKSFIHEDEEDEDNQFKKDIRILESAIEIIRYTDISNIKKGEEENQCQK